MALASMVMDPQAIPKANFIIPFSGLLSQIPAGWTLCDGTLGTPDLRNKFVVGAAPGADPGATGGANSHTHAGHTNHGVTQPGDHAAQSHAGGAVGAIAGSGAAAVKVGTSASNAEPTAHTHPAPGFTQPSQHPILSHAGTAVDAHSAHDTPDSRPPYYAVAWIMKL